MMSESDAHKLIDRIEGALDRITGFLAMLLEVLEHDHVHITINTKNYDHRRPGGGEENQNGVPRSRSPS